jgi:predicted alpha/beta hydrolase family esterase
MKPSNVLTLPGWENSGPKHWQTLWEQRNGYTRVEQHDWMKPLRGDWVARLEDVLLQCDEPAVLVAHSLGCILVAAWAAHSQNTHRVKAACWSRRATSSGPRCASSFRAGRPSPCRRCLFRSAAGQPQRPLLRIRARPPVRHAWNAQFMDYGEAAATSTPTPAWPAGPKATSCRT